MFFAKKEKEEFEDAVSIEQYETLEKRCELDRYQYETQINRVQEESTYKLIQLEKRHKDEIESLKKSHEVKIETLSQEILLEANRKITKLEKENAVLEETVKNLEMAIDWNSDIVDVKDLVSSLIQKLPNLDIKSINVNASSGK